MEQLLVADVDHDYCVIHLDQPFRQQLAVHNCENWVFSSEPKTI